MPLGIPNLDRISKDEPKVGEALKKVQDYTNTVAPVASGNAVQSPPSTSTPPASQQTVAPNTGNHPAVPAPPRSGVPRPDQL